MPDIVIQIENLSKQYRLGEVSTGSLGHDVNRWWHRVRGKEDPYLRVTHTNVREAKSEGLHEYVWAIKDISFEVQQGEVLGIIGRNGAGKSTLLKLLSRITSPTTGEVRIKGRIASLLEVGTGFHQDLTGRENIYMNGAVLGMTKQEIRTKFDEIVAFSGCEKYVDTPVKRYSSGMVVRLGFAVAAHLDPEILIVDEVLAVGDAEFQQKCIGKMQDVAGQGRTVIFVSHNMDSIRLLTRRCLVMQAGSLIADTDTAAAIHRYMRHEGDDRMLGPPKPVDALHIEQRVIADPAVIIASIGLEPKSTAVIPSGGQLRFEIGVKAATRVERLSFAYSIRHETGVMVGSGCSPLFHVDGSGLFHYQFAIEQLDLAPGNYDLHISLNRGGLTENKHAHDILYGLGSFRVTSERVEGGMMPSWLPGWGMTIHANSSVTSIKKG